MIKNIIPSHQSIIILIGRGMFSILALASMLTFISLVALSLSLSDASSINKAGALRMQSYQIAYNLSRDESEILRQQHINTFNQSLAHIKNNIVDNWDITSKLKTEFMDVNDRWQTQLDILHSNNPKQFLDNVDSFVLKIDSFVQHLQDHSEYKVKIITLIKGLGIGLIFAVCIITIRLMQVQVLKPLQQIFAASNQIRKGEFDVSFDFFYENEIGSLASNISHMAQDLNKLYSTLEQQVDAKTKQLKEAKDKINFLYTTSQKLHVTHLNADMLEQTLQSVSELNGLNFYKLVLTGSEVETIYLNSGFDNGEQTIDLKLELEEQSFGTLTVLKREANDQEHLRSYCRIISRAQHRSQSNLEAQRSLLMEERAVIARELHDSLAQALSYLKIQVALLKRHLKNQEITSATNDIVDEIDTNLKLSYTQLRELLNTFRLTLDDANLSVAISIMLTQLRQRTKSKIHLSYELEEHLFKPNQHIHILQIIREAVLNSIKHANSNEIMIDCGTNKNGTIKVSISDNGDGITANPTKSNHYGLNIMGERASKLGAKLEIKNNITKGTLVLLTFDRENKHA
ncbi:MULTISPECIES: nitrate/nitrite two-component system sensor histidine kinase NarQ [unclassified Moritella]|uniref:nitrate/nitrite two-component system sensor histidine kinase NarQ n=1 Tax=unclassified Moritella TaxID=2637987 RepID=UPI001BABF0DA|nr:MULTISPECIES: nitrate/nitrite two-component system sensor histidine kinase NarQ [unclassified Moritella]QUM85295.1 nitrate/nitrite two-component system sensor histidine kinase NarQ [Moritella sp. 28]QUM89519.1 nitrate/nitrite two-component system sensor histidine kinase NarQ [Moritella sp. 36]